MIIKRKPQMGYYVVAQDEIRKNTILSEYSGNIVRLADNLLRQHNSVMDLISSVNVNYSLVIVPMNLPT